MVEYISKITSLILWILAGCHYLLKLLKISFLSNYDSPPLKMWPFAPFQLAKTESKNLAPGSFHRTFQSLQYNFWSQKKCEKNHISAAMGAWSWLSPRRYTISRKPIQQNQSYRQQIQWQQSTGIKELL